MEDGFFTDKPFFIPIIIGIKEFMYHNNIGKYEI